MGSPRPTGPPTLARPRLWCGNCGGVMGRIDGTDNRLCDRCDLPPTIWYRRLPDIHQIRDAQGYALANEHAPAIEAA